MSIEQYSTSVKGFTILTGCEQLIHEIERYQELYFSSNESQVNLNCRCIEIILVIGTLPNPVMSWRSKGPFLHRWILPNPVIRWSHLE